MSAIEATSVRCKTLADGSLDVTLRVEPRDAIAAFRMLAAPGTPVALARLKTAPEQEADKPKGGPWSQWLAVRCGEREFQVWILNNFPGAWARSEDVAEAVRSICEVQSRAEIDNDPEAGKRFQERIRTPWQAYCKEHQNG